MLVLSTHVHQQATSQYDDPNLFCFPFYILHDKDLPPISGKFFDIKAEKAINRFITSQYQCFKNWTGPASPTGSTIDRSHFRSDPLY